MVKAFVPEVPAARNTSAWQTAKEWVAACIARTHSTAPPTPLPDVVAESVRRHVPGLTPRQTSATMNALAHDLTGLGPLAGFVTPKVSDILVDADGRIWVDTGSGITDTGQRLDPDETHQLAVRLMSQGGRRLDRGQPFGDIQLGNARIHAVLPPVVTAPQLSIRLAAETRPALDQLATSWDEADSWLAILTHLIDTGANLLISGATGSGKTTLLAALLATVPTSTRILTIEDTPELAIDHPHVVGLKTREPNTEGAGGIDLSMLIRQALRMRPDRLVVGECRGAEIADFLAAMNTGHRGAIGTLHANSVADVPARLHAMGGLAGMDPTTLNLQARSALDAVLHLSRDASGRRQPAELGVLAPAATPEEPLRLLPALRATPGGLVEGPGLKQLEDATREPSRAHLKVAS